MKIRFKKNVIVGSLSFNRGEQLDLPLSIAQAHIDDGNAVAVAQPEFAVAPRQSAPNVSPKASR